jgi:hypothetical protein
MYSHPKFDSRFKATATNFEIILFDLRYKVCKQTESLVNRARKRTQTAMENSIFCAYNKDDYSDADYEQVFISFLEQHHHDDLDQILAEDDKLAHFPLYVKLVLLHIF